MKGEKILVIVGPTASGKSALAVEIARGCGKKQPLKKSGRAQKAANRLWKSLADEGGDPRTFPEADLRPIGAEIVSADSRQVYRGMDIGSGKITKRETKGIPHHLLDVANPKRVFTVAQYQRLAHRAIADILKRGKLPIIVGGTGFYIQAIVDNIILPAVPPNKPLRKKLATKSPAQLFVILKKIDPRRAKDIDAKNPVRLIRAIEITKALGKVPKIKAQPLYDARIIGLNLGEKVLKKKIHARLLARLKQGLIAEVKKLQAGGLSWKKLEAFGLEYRYVAKFLQHKITKVEMITKLETEIWRYAKRQLTWFKRDKRIRWLKNKTIGRV